MAETITPKPDRDSATLTVADVKVLARKNGDSSPMTRTMDQDRLLPSIADARARHRPILICRDRQCRSRQCEQHGAGYHAARTTTTPKMKLPRQEGDVFVRAGGRCGHQVEREIADSRMVPLTMGSLRRAKRLDARNNSTNEKRLDRLVVAPARRPHMSCDFPERTDDQEGCRAMRVALNDA